MQFPSSIQKLSVRLISYSGVPCILGLSHLHFWWMYLCHYFQMYHPLVLVLAKWNHIHPVCTHLLCTVIICILFSQAGLHGKYFMPNLPFLTTSPATCRLEIISFWQTLHSYKHVFLPWENMTIYRKFFILIALLIIVYVCDER